MKSLGQLFRRAAFVAVVVGLVGSNAALGLGSLEWKPAASMGTPRTEGMTATTLVDGRVLVAGGRDATGQFLRSAEVYSPATDTWTTTGAMVQPRGVGSTATRLQDGRVFVAGGQCDCGIGSATNSAEIYDPATGIWSATTPMSATRYLHTATLLADGRVLVAGGYGTNWTTTQDWATAETYDATTNTWAPAGTMSMPRDSHAASLLADGRVLVTGGRCDDSGACDTASADVYDPLTNSWSATAPMSIPRVSHAQVRLHNGRVMVIGGYSLALGTTQTVESFDPALGVWLPEAPTVTPTWGVVAGVLPSGQILIASGDEGPDPRLTQIFDPISHVWRPAGRLTTIREEAAGAVLDSGQMLIVGGFNGCFPDCTLASTEVSRPRPVLPR